METALVVSDNFSKGGLSNSILGDDAEFGVSVLDAPGRGEAEAATLGPCSSSATWTPAFVPALAEEDEEEDGDDFAGDDEFDDEDEEVDGDAESEDEDDDFLEDDDEEFDDDGAIDDDDSDDDDDL
jgi:hypothetical protein